MKKACTNAAIILPSWRYLLKIGSPTKQNDGWMIPISKMFRKVINKLVNLFLWMKKLKDKIRTIFVTISKMTEITVTFRTIPSSLKIDSQKRDKNN